MINYCSRLPRLVSGRCLAKTFQSAITNSYLLCEFWMHPVRNVIVYITRNLIPRLSPVLFSWPHMWPLNCPEKQRSHMQSREQSWRRPGKRLHSVTHNMLTQTYGKTCQGPFSMFCVWAWIRGYSWGGRTARDPFQFQECSSIFHWRKRQQLPNFVIISFP